MDTNVGVNLNNYRVVRYIDAVAGDIAVGSTFAIGSTNAAGDLYVTMGSYNSEGNFYNKVDAKGGSGYLDVPSNQVMLITLEDAGEGKFYLKDSEDKYLVSSSSGSGSNYLYQEDGTEKNDYYKWTVSTNSLVNVGKNTRSIQYNSASPRFSTYTSSQQAIKLYYYPGPKLSGTAIAFDDATSHSKYSTLTPSNLTSVSYTFTSKPEWISAVAFVGNTMTVTASENHTLSTRDGNIIVKASGDEGDAYATVYVSQPASLFSSPSTTIEFAWNEMSEVKSITFTSTFPLTDSNISIDDDSYFDISITDIGSSQYQLDVIALSNNTSGANYEATVTVGRDGLEIDVAVSQLYEGAGAEPPTFSKTSGETFACTENVTISTETIGATIYYTTDGTEPTLSSNHGAEGTSSATIKIAPNIKSKAYLSGTWSDLSSANYYVYVSKTINDYAAGTQYAENEKHDMGDGFVIYTTDCHFTTELRIYSSGTHNGYVVSDPFPGNISKIEMNVGYKDDKLDVYGSNDGSSWTKIGQITSESTYSDQELSFGVNSFKRFKLDVAGSQQVRIKSMKVTYY